MGVALPSPPSVPPPLLEYGPEQGRSVTDRLGRDKPELKHSKNLNEGRGNGQKFVNLMVKMNEFSIWGRHVPEVPS